MDKNSLNNKVQKSEEVIKKAFIKYGDKLAVAWTGGKDSTVLLHIIKTCFNGKVPFPVMFNDSTMEFEEVYDFIEKITKEWKLKLIVIEHLKKDLKEFYKILDIPRKEKFSRQMKINAINYAVKKYKLKGFLVAIRWDEHESRSKEKYFSSREDHIRVHPVLHFKENDIWNYIRCFKIPYVSLYGKYRSLGEKPFTKPSVKGMGERSGRETSKESTMQQLRNLGYW